MATSTEALHSAVKTFTNQVTARHKDHDNDQVTVSALLLIRQLPVARNAVLSYFGRKFDDAANRYLQAQVDRITGNQFNPAYSEESINASLKPIAVSFAELIEDKSWAPQLSKWAIDLLGHISKKLMSTNAGPLASSVNTVEEQLELWMSCSATKVLIEITANCFSTLVENPSSVDGCVESLLDASIRYAPHFDWVVAHLGSCFPVTIIDRVLVAGLKDFTAPIQNASRFASASAILGYLSGQHTDAARQCVKKYFQNILNQPPPGAAAAVTFLLKVSTGSPMMIRALTSDLLSTMNIQTLNKLAAHFVVGSHDFMSLLHLTVHLILRLDQTVLATTSLLLDLVGGHEQVLCDHEPLRPEVKDAAKVILHHLSEELEKITISQRIPNKLTPELPYLKHITMSYKALMVRLHRTGSDEKEARSVCRILMAIAWYGGKHTSISILVELLSLKRSWLMNTFDAFLQQLLVRHSDTLKSLVTAVFAPGVIEKQVLKNLTDYIASKTETAELLGTEVARHHLHTLAILMIEDRDILPFTCSLVNNHKYLHSNFITINESLVQCFMEELLQRNYVTCNTIQTSLLVLCKRSKASLSAVLQAVVTHSLKQPFDVLFGAKSLTAEHADVGYGSLSKSNSSLLTRLQLPATMSYILHTEYIGQGKRSQRNNLTKDEIFCASQHLLGLIAACCEQQCTVYTSAEARNILAHIVIELFSPDVIATITRWSEPITHERELAIKRAVDDHPISWHIISYVCSERKCFLSAQLLVRCYLATLITIWSNCRDTPARNLPKEYEASQKLISLLLLADILPEPLNHVQLLMPHITTYELKIVFDIIYRVVQSAIDKTLSHVELEHDDLKSIQAIVQQNIADLSDVCSHTQKHCFCFNSFDKTCIHKTLKMIYNCVFFIGVLTIMGRLMVLGPILMAAVSLLSLGILFLSMMHILVLLFEPANHVARPALSSSISTDETSSVAPETQKKLEDSCGADWLSDYIDSTWSLALDFDSSTPQEYPASVSSSSAPEFRNWLIHYMDSRLSTVSHLNEH